MFSLDMSWSVVLGRLIRPYVRRETPIRFSGESPNALEQVHAANCLASTAISVAHMQRIEMVFQLFPIDEYVGFPCEATLGRQNRLQTWCLVSSIKQ